MTQEQHIFEKLFNIGNDYFAPFYINADEDKLRKFFLRNDDKRKYLTHLFLYLESLVCVREKIGTLANFEKRGDAAPLYADRVWYATILMIILGIADKTISAENINRCSECQRLENKSLKSFKKLMSHLKPSERNSFIHRYKDGSFSKKTFDEIVEDIYNDRNLFAHDVANLSTPSYLGLSQETKYDDTHLKLNLKHEEIFLYIIVALMRQWGYQSQIYVSRPEIISFVDLI